MNEHILNVEAVIKHGEEDVEIAEKTWPLAIPANTRLVAILTNAFFWGDSSLNVAIDITERPRYEMYLEQFWNGKWSSIRMFYLPKDKLELCQKKFSP